ncbi:hypothetical protein GALMADRAFT_1268985 [Galerina marginata CBS 339.88]|uniref:Uncharacterized protein n=1 Tax=Galerina marginata (strain CBS 339.88) TaxID=685588 RepID=A0A067T6G0_GALM3|nr:hypothetical protein GALMADRAFT_1268985 [Galerina marginata CBS 339.88]
MPTVSIPLSPNRVETNTFEYDYDPISPYPPSSPSADSDMEDCHFLASNATLRTSIASIPESRLRSIVIKLADSNPRFHRAIVKELAFASTDSPPTTPTNPKPYKSRRNRTRRNRNCKGLSVSTQVPYLYKRKVASSQSLAQTECIYHPGHLDEEVYEFLSRTPDDVTFNVVRTITMWSCCDEDEWSPGCVVAPSYTVPVDLERQVERINEYSHPDVYPDSDLEQRYEDLLHDKISRCARDDHL